MILTLITIIRAIREGGDDGEAVRYGLGWWSPEMKPHYRRLLDGHRWFHSLINCFTEWTRLDAQRAAKFYLDIILTILLICAI